MNTIIIDDFKIYKQRDANGELLYDWPYSNRCGKCKAEAVVEGVCTNCGRSYHQERCPRCGKWMHHEWIDKELGYCTLYCKPEIEREEQRKKDISVRENYIPKIQKDSENLYRISTYTDDIYLNKRQFNALKLKLEKGVFDE